MMNQESFFADSRALSVRQPWANLLVEGRKVVELRSWRTDFEGLVWIHASRAEGPGDSRLVRGAYVGAVTLIGCLELDDERWETWRGSHQDPGGFVPGTWGWLMDDAMKFEEPLEGRGQLGLYHPSPNQLERLVAAYLTAAGS